MPRMLVLCYNNKFRQKKFRNAKTLNFNNLLFETHVKH